MDEQKIEVENVSPYLKKESRSTVWIAFLFLTCLLIIFFRLFNKEFIANASFGYLIGYNGVITLVVWGIFHAIFTRKKSTASKISFLVIFACLILSSFVSIQQQRQQAKNAINSMKSEFSRLDKNISKTSQGLAIIEKSDLTKTNSRGEFGELEKFVKNNLNQTIMIRNEMVREMQAIKWETILSPQRIENDVNFSDTWKMLNKAHEIIENGEKSSMAYFDDVVKSANELNVSSTMRAGLENGIINSMEISKNETRQIYQYEYGILADLKKLFEFLYNNKDWTVSNNKITFNKEKDAAIYNSIFADILNKAKLEALIQKKAAERVRSNLDNVSKKLE